MKEKLEPYQEVLKSMKEVLPNIPIFIDSLTEENKKLREENERLKKGLGFDLEKYNEDLKKEILKGIDNHLKKKQKEK